MVRARGLRLLFPLAALPAVACAQAGAAPGIDFDHYHTLAEIGEYLEGVAAAFPELVTLIEIGRSREGRPIWAVDINNPASGSTLTRYARGSKGSRSYRVDSNV